MMKMILQELTDARSSSSSLIFHSYSKEKIYSTRNKKLSMRLSKSITLFSFLSHFSDLFGPFFILSLFFFLIQIAQLPNFYSKNYFFFRLSHLSHIYLYIKARKKEENQNYDHDFTLFFQRNTKELWRQNFSFIFRVRSEENYDKKSCMHHKSGGIWLNFIK